jgi:hypothetical protein
LEESPTADRWDLERSGEGGLASGAVPLGRSEVGSSFGGANIDGIARVGNALVGLSGSRSRACSEEGSMDSGSSNSGLGGNGFKAPGEVRYVISCKHLLSVLLLQRPDILLEVFSTSRSRLWISRNSSDTFPSIHSRVGITR